MKYPLLEKMIEEAKSNLPLGVVYPLSAPALETVIDLVNKQLCTPILIGPEDQIRELAGANGFLLDGIQIVDTPQDPILATQKAVEMVKEGKLAVLMKGSLHTEDLMGPIVSRTGLRTERRTSHLFLFELDRYPKLLGVSDCVVNIAPNADQKIQILKSSLEALNKLGIHKTKGIDSRVAGDPDLLLVPDLQVGNILYKSLVYMAGAECAGTILGATVPIILTSRSDSVFSRVASTAMAILLAKNSHH